MGRSNASASFQPCEVSAHVFESSALRQDDSQNSPNRKSSSSERRLPIGIVSLESISRETSFTGQASSGTMSVVLLGQPNESLNSFIRHDHPESLARRKAPSCEIASHAWFSTMGTSCPIILVDTAFISSVTLAFVAGCRFLFTREVSFFSSTLSVLLLYAVVGGLLGLFRVAGLHPVAELRKGLITGALAIGLSVVFGAIGVETVTNRILVGMAGVPLFAFVLPVSRFLGRAALSRFSWWGVRAVIVGEGPQAHAFHRFFRAAKSRGIRPLGLIRASNHFSIVDREGMVMTEDQGDCLGALNELGFLQRQHEFSLVIVASDAASRVDVSDIMARLEAPVQILVVPPGESLPSLWCETSDLGGVIGIRWNDQLRRPLATALKRSLDLVLSLIALALLAPLFAIVSALIKLVSPGPIFYAHERIGRSGAIFRTWKFRTMVLDAEERLLHVLASDPERLRQWEADQKLREDPRVVPFVGRFLRKTSLDELPQLWNVVVGEMSLVGPRPIVKSEIEKYGDEYPLYLSVRPGITGLWQVSGRNDTTYDQRVSLDRFYVRNWSLSLDLYLLCRTLRTTLFCEGAY